MTILYYYTGTGNSLWVARQLAARLKDAELIPMVTGNPILADSAEKIGFIFPVHIWGLPHRVIEFVESIPSDPQKYYFALAVNAGQVAATLLQLGKLMEKRGLILSTGFDIVMPSNYIPWGGAAPQEKQEQLFAMANEKISKIAESVQYKDVQPPEKGPLWQNILFSAIYKLSFSRVPTMDKDFWADENCNSCGICAKICPSGNIDMVQRKKPAWQGRCEQCLACIQWCPQEAIQYGKKTPKYARYHQPEISVADMITSVSPKSVI